MTPPETSIADNPRNAGPSHPFRVAWRTRDIKVWAEALAPDIQLHSPLLQSPFVGRQAAIELYRVFFEAFGKYEITAAFDDGDAQAFFWRAELGGRIVEGVDLVHCDDSGKITEIRVFMRPLVDLATLAAATGPQLAAAHGRSRGMLARLLSKPMQLLFSLVDVIATRLTHPR